MVRTKANCGAMRATAEKATRKNFGGTSSRLDLGSPSSKKDKMIGGNPVCPQPTPNWQKPINNFFTKSSKPEDNRMECNKENVSPAKRRIADERTEDQATSSHKVSKGNGAVITMEEGISELE